MTVFEDLIVELKEENLLEETVISVGDSTGAMFAIGNSEHDFADLIDEPSFEAAGANRAAIDEPAKPQRNSSAHNFAVEQVATFQLVEHVLTSIERTVLNRNTRGFDELGIKKAIHRFQQVSADPSTMECAEAEAELAHEVAGWQRNLADRDGDVTVGVMREYCENCQPALSAQALFSLARFYRSIPYSEAARGKYEFIVTRLFSRRGEGERRTVICSKEEMLGHLRSRFRDAADGYSNLPGDDADAMLAVLTFDDFMAEAQAAESFDDLVAVNFFGRLYQFKEMTGRNFFGPTVSAAAINANLTVANKLADLFTAVREAGNADELRTKFSTLYDESISNAVGRTLTLSSLLAEPVVEESDELVEEEPTEKAQYHEVIDVTRDLPKTPKAGSVKKAKKKVNRGLIVTTVVVVLLSVGLYVWANYYSDAATVSANVKTVDLTQTEFKDTVKEARISGEIFYGITTPAWDGLTKEAQQESLARLLKFGLDKGYKRVSLINPKGQTVGYAVDGRADVFRIE
jgi:hypothetical protein